MAGEGHGVEGERKLCSGEVKKEVWEEKEAADGGMWLVAGKTNSGRKSSLLIDVLQDDPENKISILNAEISSSLDHQSVTDKDVKNLDTLMQLSHRIVQEPLYQALYESNSINLLTELGDSQKKFIGSSSIYRASTVDISDASAMSLPTDSAIKNADHESAAAKDIESSDTQMQLAPYGSNNSDILFGLGNSQKKFISSSSLHGVNSFDTSDTLSWMNLQISDAIENSDHQFAADKDFQSSDTQMQIARRIGKEPSCQSLYGSNNSDQLIGLGNYKKFVSSSSLHGSSTVDISDALSSMNLWAGSVTENTDHLLAAEEETQNSDTRMQLALQIVKEPSHKTLYGSNNCNQLTGCSHYNKKFIGSSSFHGVNTVDTSDALSRRKLQADFMIENADHRPAADKDILSSDTQMQPALPVVKELPYQAVYRRNNSDQPIELDCYKGKFIGSSSSHGVNAVDISDALSGMNLRADSKIKNNDRQFPADGDIQNSDMPMQLAFQTANKSSYQHGGNSSNQLIGLGDSRKKSISLSSFHGANTIEISDAFSSMNLQADSMIENADFHQSKLQRQIDDCENIMFGSREPKSEFLSTPAILQQTSQFSELNKHKFGVLACSGSSLFRPGEHVEQSKGMTLSAHPYHPVSSMSQAAGSSVSSSQYPHVGNLNLNFPEYQSRYPIDPALQSTIEAFESPAGNTPFTLTEPSYRGNFGFAESNSQSYQEMDLGGAGSPEMSLLRLAVTERLQRRYGKAVAREAQALYDHDDEPPVQLGSAEDFAKVIAVHEACIHALLYPDEHVPIHLMGKSARLENHFAHDAMGIQMSRPGSHAANAVALAPGPGVLRLGDHGLGDPSAFQWSGADFMQIYRSSEPDNENSSSPSFMEVFKNAKNQCFQLIHIKGHVLEFSGDQFGSRFIQQKLPTATLEEKAMVFEELMPHVLPLITDIFGNYVVQKFIEHGTPFHRMILAEKLVGRVLSLSFHMYGCRVIQKALEYNGLDQKIEIAKELDGSILRCIYDQNGNHVIQKCIEHVPQEHIQFIVESIYGNVLNLSAHPYGCRVIQRVLENCNDPATQQMVVSEIVEDACVLSQHQYGNYVVQHVLVHGSPLERSAIVRKLSGQIVRLSQQKCASNVIEKCLLYGGRGDRQLIINEIFRISGEIEPLKVMMQDQFANYVIQKVIETCDDWQRELILERIRVHLSTLRNYTYGKHVVSRVEKLITTGERRMMFPRQLPRRF